MSILKSDRIHDLLVKGLSPDALDPLAVVPQPFNMEEFRDSGSASIDLRLGCWFVTLRRPRVPLLSIDRKHSESEVSKTHYVPFGSNFYLHAQSFVLGVTMEWIRLPKTLAAYVVG